ncbi:MAG: flagellar hook-basal body complex protein FliE [Planctomycetota bacterium]|jgi:flagellar hook-basal body complex protein FliE
MPTPISSSGGLSPIKPIAPSQTTRPAETVTGKDFKSILLENLEEVNRLQAEADQGVQRLLTGETDNVAEVFAAVNKAGIAFDLLMEIRNKLQEAYRDIQQMRV